ncbi:hypothetical protein SteCoe_20820 [Stentor coeruleus]|uniref:Uncharacterized protein n=1 Tax=Stentor coeruleus TaxID=5963 RepID=A0A1R2BR18_9CILI|nr:hypothetical protein SteCoe_20820 [Stentor coeruleus]
MSITSSESSDEIPQLPCANPSEHIEYPHKEPSAESEFYEFFNSLFSINLGEADQQEIKAFCSVLERATINVREKLAADDRIENFIYTIIVRADVMVSDLIEIYAPVESEKFIKLIPILIWIFLSQKSKRFVEPLLVKYYESMKTKYQDFLKNITYGGEINRLSHTPISNEEKSQVVLIYLACYLYNLESITEGSVKCFLALVRNMITGIDSPPYNLITIDEDIQFRKANMISSEPLIGSQHKILQHKFSREEVLIILYIISKFPDYYNISRKFTTELFLTYCQKELIPEGIFLCQYLLTSVIID